MFDMFKSSLVSAKQVGETIALNWLTAGVLDPGSIDQWHYDCDATVAAVKASKPSAPDMIGYYSEMFAERPDIILEILRFDKRTTVVHKLMLTLLKLNVAEENIPLIVEACEVVSSRFKPAALNIPSTCLHEWIAAFGDPAIRAFTGHRQHRWKLDAGSLDVRESYGRHLLRSVDSTEEFMDRLPVVTASDRLDMVQDALRQNLDALDVFAVAEWCIDHGIQVDYKQFLKATFGLSIVQLKDAAQTYAYFKAGLTDAPESEWYPVLVSTRKDLVKNKHSPNGVPLESIDQYLALPSSDLYNFGEPYVSEPLGVVDAKLLLKLLHVDSVEEHCPRGALRYLARIFSFTRDAAELSFKANKDMPLYHVGFDVTEEFRADKKRVLDEDVNDFWATMFDNRTFKIQQLSAEVISEVREEILASPQLSLQALFRSQWLPRVIFHGMSPQQVADIITQRVAERVVETSGNVVKNKTMDFIFPSGIKWSEGGYREESEVKRSDLWYAFVLNLFKYLKDKPLGETGWSLGILVDMSGGYTVQWGNVAEYISLKNPSEYLHGLKVIMRLLGYESTGIPSRVVAGFESAGSTNAGKRILEAALHDEELMDYLLQPFIDEKATGSLPHAWRGIVRARLIADDKIPMGVGDFSEFDLDEDHPVFQRIVSKLGGQEESLILLQELSQSWSGYLGELIETAKLAG